MENSDGTVLLVDLLGSFGVSFVTSCARPYWRRVFGGDWYDLALYAIGVLLMWPVFEKLHHDILLEEGPMRRSIAYLLAAGSVGAGAVGGRVAVPEPEKRNDQ